MRNFEKSKRALEIHRKGAVIRANVVGNIEENSVLREIFSIENIRKADYFSVTMEDNKLI
jgi:hypothetical protein